MALQVDQHQAVTDFGRPVGEHHVVGGRRSQPACDKRRCTGDEPVHQNHLAAGRSLDHGSCHHGNFKTTHGSQHGQRCFGIAVLARNLEQDPQFVVQLFIVQARATPHGVVELHVAKAGEQQRRAGGVANAHFTEGDDVAGQVIDHIHASTQRRQGLRPCHGLAARHVACAKTDLSAQQGWRIGRRFSGVGYGRCHACIDNGHVETVLARQYVHGGSAAHHVHHHLDGDGLRVSRHTLIGNAMVGGKHHHLRLIEGQCGATLNQSDLQREALQLAQCADGFGFVVQLVAQCAFKCCIGRRGNLWQLQ